VVNTRLYTFDGNTFDATLQANGISVGTFTQPPFGYGYLGLAIYLTSSGQQYVNIPYINISQRSFTIEMWLIPYVGTGTAINQLDFGVFGQCDMYQKCFFSIAP
jgi:hypothetical protein